MKTSEICDNKFFICINAYKVMDNTDDIRITSFDEDDSSLYFDVSGFYTSSDMLYSIASSCYNDFLQYEIDVQTLHNFSAESILAHCFYEITCYGFEDNVTSTE